MSKVLWGLVISAAQAWPQEGGGRRQVSHQSVQSLSHVRLFVTPWTAACQASLSISNSWNLFKFMSIDSVMPSNHLILCHLLLLLPSIFPSIRVFSDESVLGIRWPKYWSFRHIELQTRIWMLSSWQSTLGLSKCFAVLS